MHRSRVAARWLVFALLTSSSPIAAQGLTRPALHWETVRTTHFSVHFPSAMRPWALDAAGRLEGIRDAVVALVGRGPSRRVTVVVDDPYNVTNGAALPVLDAPTIILWPTPPEPDDELGQLRDWSEMLAVHEFTHIAHLTWPSRNPLQRILWRILPIGLSPIARRAPRWMIEGYATYAEGRLTGSGRPHSAARAAVLREFALEGRLPTYGELNGSPRYLGGAMAYLTGSAFLEWLVARSGEESLPRLWRRMTARQDRDFVAAFTGVYGDTPQALYGRFTTELTGKALRAQEAITAAGLDSGAIFQHLTWYTGDPAVSTDGRFVAVPVRSPFRPTRIVVWSTAPDTTDSARTAAANARLLSRDPDDVPPVRPFPAPRRPVATLEAARGRGFDQPRFFASGDRLLVSHDEPRPDGALRPDLYEWNLRTAQVRRITRGAAVRSADPAPDGSNAIGVRCRDGVCDVVRVELERGDVEVLLAGSPTRQYYRPRFAPDGRQAIVAVHENDHWHLEVFAVGDAGSHDVRAVGPADHASRYGASYLPGGGAVVCVSEAGGEQHLEIVDLLSGRSRALAATTGATVAPDASQGDSDVYFLTLSAQGRDLHHIRSSAAREDAAAPQLSPDLAPAAVPMPIESADSFPARPVPEPTSYGLGPRAFRYLPGGSIATDGRFASLVLASSDPVGRLEWTVQATLGDRATWRGGALAAAWRGSPVVVGASLFAASQSPSHQAAGRFVSDSLDAVYRGAVLSLGLRRYGSLLTSQVRVGGSAGRLALAGGPGHSRALAFASYHAGLDLSRGDLTLLASLGALGTVGRTDATDWRRVVAEASVAAGFGGSVGRYAVTYGRVSHGAPAFEQMVAGGATPPLTDTALLSQRLAMPALPLGTAGGPDLLAQRLEDDTGPLSLYFERLSTTARRSARHDVYGVELRGSLPSVPFLSVPSIAALAGVGYSLSAPFKYKLRGYVGLRYSP